MKKIEYSIAAIKSLNVLSSAGSEDIEEIEEEEIDQDMIEEEEVAETVMSVSDEDFENLSPEDFQEVIEERELGDDEDEESKAEVNEDEEPESAEEGESKQTEEEEENIGDQPIDDGEDNDMYAKTYKKLFGEPIRASGREVKLRDAEHARNLVQLGVDYNKKMQNMRPHMQALKTLEKEGLLDDNEQLNLLLEAKDGNPEAIKKLIAQANIDMLDISDTEGAGDYRAQNRMVSEQEVAIGEAISAIKESPKYSDTINVMQNVFDQKSREIISDNPNYIAALNQDIESGVYDGVMDAIQYKRDMRAVPAGMSDIELYIATVQEMAQAQAQRPVAPTQPEPTPINRRSTGSSRKRKAAMSGSRGTRKKKEQNFDPMDALGMSDDDFDKQFGDQLQ